MDEVKLLPCTQADREAAASLVEWQNGTGWEPKFFHPDLAKNMREGVFDNHPVVQAFAVHARPPIGTDEVVGPGLGAIPGSHPADQAPSGLGASRFDPERVQKAFRDRLTVYAAKMEKADPFAEDDANRHERYKFAIECFEYFAFDAGLDFPPELSSERTGA